MCCHHGVQLVDADQEVPPETDIVLRMKFRFFHEDPDDLPAASLPPGGEKYANAFFMFHEGEQNHGESLRSDLISIGVSSKT